MRIAIVYQAQEFVFEVGDQEAVTELKRKIELFVGVAVAEQSLSVSGWELIDGLDMEDYPIVTEGTKIDLNVKAIVSSFTNCRTKIPITVKFSSRQINIEVETTDTVRSLKEKIHIVGGTPIKRMSLFCSGMELEDDFRNLSEYAVHEFSEIIVFLKGQSKIRDESVTRKLSVVIQTSSSLLNAASIPLEIGESNTVSDLRQLLLSRNILPQDDYLFIHKQRIMRDNCSLQWHGVENGDPIYVFNGTVSRSGY